uniref:Uncharacterized protein n=1 Tax=Arundo donax TaxID=35708 RepID=A0A0A9CBQ8_ARUDO
MVRLRHKKFTSREAWRCHLTDHSMDYPFILYHISSSGGRKVASAKFILSLNSGVKFLYIAMEEGWA